jgi:hypothetical protein
VPIPEQDGYKVVYLLGPLPATLEQLAVDLDPDDVLLPYPGSSRPFSKAEYEYWRDTFLHRSRAGTDSARSQMIRLR